jgi:hypothetical protein
MESSSDERESLSAMERELEAQYVHTLHMLGLSPSEARRAFWHIMNEIKEEARTTGTSTVPRNFGDWLLERENIDGRVQTMLAKRRAEGVTDQDIRWWWNMHHLERAMMCKLDDLNRHLLLTRFIEHEGLRREEAARKLASYDPLFGEPGETHADRHEDQPLPYELKERVQSYLQKRSILDPEAFTREIKESSSLNALIRKEVQRGNL